MENSKFKPDYFKVAYSIRTPSYYRPRTTDSVFGAKRKVWRFMRIADGYSEMAAGKLNTVMPSTANPACICTRSSSSEPSMRSWSMRFQNSLLRQRYFSFSRMANGLLRKSMTSQRSSSGNTLQQSVRKLKRNFSTHSGLQKIYVRHDL